MIWIALPCLLLGTLYGLLLAEWFHRAADARQADNINWPDGPGALPNSSSRRVLPRRPASLSKN